MATATTAGVTDQPLPPWEGLRLATATLQQRPRIAAGVESAEQRTRRGVPYVVIRNPAGRAYLKLTPEEHALLPLLDGSRTLKEVVLADYERTGQLSFPRVAGLVRMLHENAFLSEPPPRDVYETLARQLRGVSIGDWFTRATRLFHGGEVAISRCDPTLDWLYRHGGRLFFTRTAFWLGLALGALGAVFFALELSRGRYPLFRAGDSYLLGILLFGVLEAVTLTIHELGHGLGVKHAGRYAPRAGIMPYFGVPCVFVDTSDVWMAPRKQRLITSFAGPFSGLVIAGFVAVIAYFLPESALGGFLFAWAFVLVLNMVLNFNPLLELDGYYMLIDLVEKPMLRPRSFAFLRGPAWQRLWRRERLQGDEPFLLVFGLAAVSCGVAVLVLGLLLWTERSWPAIQEVWASGRLDARAAIVAGGAVATVVVLAWLRTVSFAAARRLAFAVAALSRQGRARRHRRAVSALRAIPMLANAPEARLVDIARRARWEYPAAGTDVVRQGEHGSTFYMIVQGEFEVTQDGVPVNHLGAGDYFGELALLHDAPRSATVRAIERATLLALDREDFDAVLRQDVDLRERLKRAASFRELVANMPLFQELGPAQLDLILSRLSQERVPAGTVIIREGDPGDRFYIVASGRLEVTRTGMVLDTMVPGDSFGEIALLTDGPRRATVAALEECELLGLGREDFEDLLMRYLDRNQEIERLSHLRLESHRRLDEVARGEG